MSIETEKYEPDYLDFEGGDNAFSGSLGDDDLQYINVASKKKLQDSTLTFFNWLEGITSKEKGKSFFNWLN